MSYLSAAALNALQANPSLIEDYYVQGWRQFASDLGELDANLQIGGSLLPVAYAAMIAFDLKPYGSEPSVFDLNTLINAPSLACDDYVRLAWWFTTLMPQTRWAPVKIAALGWLGGAVGNHAQMLATDGKITLLLDPTVGLVAKIGYDALLRGHIGAAVTSFWKYHAERTIGSFEQVVRAAISQGRYQPSDAMYYCDSLERFNTLPAMSQMMTPAASAYRPV